ncbi:hypothetical protein HK414_15815 [Ramlibacter terrae]|uniref:Secreted protein n=1 Tax=Ramlibacter terrae TaxID=2732511 RepID=A0ABX6P3I6_9BURK|nr:hypothetical protein HK414_15815 [Ramlibacter terrae]
MTLALACNCTLALAAVMAVPCAPTIRPPVASTSMVEALPLPVVVREAFSSTSLAAAG